MIPGYRLCDVCGKKTQHRIPIIYGRCMDAAGSMDNAGEDWDLCPCCIKDALNYCIRDHDLASKLCDYLHKEAIRKKSKP